MTTRNRIQKLVPIRGLLMSLVIRNKGQTVIDLWLSEQGKLNYALPNLRHELLIADLSQS